MISPSAQVARVRPLLTDGDHRMAAQRPQAAYHRTVVSTDAVPEDLEEVVEDVPHVVKRVGPFIVGGSRQRLPRLGILYRRGLKSRYCAASELDAFGFDQQVQQLPQPVPEAFPVHHVVQQTATQVVLRGVDVGRQLTPGGLDHSSYRRKPDHRTGLRYDDVGQVGEAPVRLAGRWVGQHGNEGHAGFAQTVDRGDRFRHLHQRKDPFLGASAAAGDHGDHREASARRQLKCQRHFFAHHTAHAAAHEPVVQHRQHHASAADAAGSRHRRLGQPRPVLILRQLNVVVGGNRLAPVGERQRGQRTHVTIMLAKAASVRNHLDPFARRQRVVESAVGADAVVQICPRIADRFVAEQAVVVHRRKVQLFQLIAVAE